MWSTKAKEIFEKLEPLAEGMGLKIVELDLPQGPNGIFRVYVDSLDKTVKVTIEDCARLSPVVSSMMDTLDVFKFRYYFEMSSPGLDRPIRRWDEISDFIGKKIKVSLKEKLEDRRHVSGILESIADDGTFFTVKDETREFKIDRGLVKKINIIWEGVN